MLEAYLQIFYAYCVQLVPLIPAVLGVYLVVSLTAQLLFER